MSTSDDAFDRDLKALVEKQRQLNPGFDTVVEWRLTGQRNTWRQEQQIANPPPKPFTLTQTDDKTGKVWEWVPTAKELKRLEAVKHFVAAGVVSDFEGTTQATGVAAGNFWTPEKLPAVHFGDPVPSAPAPSPKKSRCKLVADDTALEDLQEGERGYTSLWALGKANRKTQSAALAQGSWVVRRKSGSYVVAIRREQGEFWVVLPDDAQSCIGTGSDDYYSIPCNFNLESDF